MSKAHQNGIKTTSAQEREAYADPSYTELLKGLAAAIEAEEVLKWEMEAARLDIEIFRTREATNRMQDRAHQWNSSTSGANPCLNWLPASIVSGAAAGHKCKQRTPTCRNMAKAVA